MPRDVLTNHALHTVVADRQHKAGQGLLLGVRKSLNFGVRPWFPSCGHSGSAWLQTTQPGSNEQFFVRVCCLPPACSTQLRGSTIGRRLQALQRELSAASAVGTVILGGDFNAKLGSSDIYRPQPHDAGAATSWLQLPLLPLPPPDR